MISGTHTDGVSLCFRLPPLSHVPGQLRRKSLGGPRACLDPHLGTSAGRAGVGSSSCPPLLPREGEDGTLGERKPLRE